MRTTKSGSSRSSNGKLKSARRHKRKKKKPKSKLRGTTGSGLRISGGRLARCQRSSKKSWSKRRSKGRKKKPREGQSPLMLRLCEKELLRKASGERMPTWRSCGCKVRKKNGKSRKKEMLKPRGDGSRIRLTCLHPH